MLDWSYLVTGKTVIQIMCPKLTCRRILAVPIGARGKMVRCRGCGTTIRVPEAKVMEEPGLVDDANAQESPMSGGKKKRKAS